MWTGPTDRKSHRIDRRDNRVLEYQESLNQLINQPMPDPKPSEKTGQKIGRKLGMMLSTRPEHPNLNNVLELSRTALEGGHEVYLYLIDEGTRAVDHRGLQDLKARGLKLFVCAYGAQRQGIGPSDRAVFCGLVVLSDLLKGCDKFLTFN